MLSLHEQFHAFEAKCVEQTTLYSFFIDTTMRSSFSSNYLSPLISKLTPIKRRTDSSLFTCHGHHMLCSLDIFSFYA